MYANILGILFFFFFRFAPFLSDILSVSNRSANTILSAPLHAPSRGRRVHAEVPFWLAKIGHSVNRTRITFSRYIRVSFYSGVDVKTLKILFTIIISLSSWSRQHTKTKRSRALTEVAPYTSTKYTRYINSTTISRSRVKQKRRERASRLV